MILVVLVLRSSNSGSSGSTSSTTISSITTWGPYHGGGAVDTQHETIYIYIYTHFSGQCIHIINVTTCDVSWCL